jgi:hypothetical protein
VLGRVHSNPQQSFGLIMEAFEGILDKALLLWIGLDRIHHPFEVTQRCRTLASFISMTH